MKKSNSKCTQNPKGTTFKKGRWVYQTMVNGKQKEISLKHKNQLLREDCPCSLLHSVVESLGQTPSNSLERLVNKFLKSQHFVNLSASTQKGYLVYWKTIGNTKLKNGRQFKDVPYAAITPGAIRKYLDKRQEEGVTTGANREVEFLSSVFSWGFERDLVLTNPCRGVRHNKETSRTRLITQEEYSELLTVTLGSQWYSACELAYLCRARRNEVFNLDIKKDISEKGVFIARSKGSFDEITTWTPRLRTAIDYAIEQRKKITKKLAEKNKPIPMHSKLFIKEDGSPLTSKNALDSAWQRIVKKLIDKGVVTNETKFTFHDIKACGVTNHPLHESGHKSEKAKAVYLRGTKEVQATE